MNRCPDIRLATRRDAEAVALESMAALSHATAFPVSRYCEDESRCRRSILRDLLADEGAKLEG